MDLPRAITKVLLPARRTNLLHRSRLVNFLHDHIERKLLLVSASAGYGKTSLLIDFASETTLPVCWYSLDASDSDPKVFLEYIIASLRRQFSGFGTRTLGLLESTTALRDIDVIVGTLVTEIHESIPSYFVLILDDYHTVEESETVNHLLDTFLRLLPENTHIILASRTLPSKLTLTRLTARQEIAGLGANELRFTSDEIRSLLQQNYQVELSDAQVAELAEHSEGWITGILLTTHTLWKGLFRDLVRLQGPHSHVFNYLANEVFALQSPEIQRFLLDTCIFDQLDPKICDELLGTRNAADMLSNVEQKNLFITRLEEAEAWYRYHHLFQEFLQSRLVESDAARWRDLNQRAAQLFEARSIWDQAIAHYLKAKLFDDAARVIERIAQETFDAGHWTTLARWIDTLPSETLDVRPDLLVSRAMVLGETTDLNHAITVFSHALAIYERRTDTTGIGRTLVKQAMCQRLQGRYQEAIENCQRALTILGEAAKGDIAEAHRLIGIAYVRLGNLAKGIEKLESALRLYESLNDLTRVALLHHDLGVAYRTAGRTDAEKHFQQALDYWRRANNTAGLANTLNSIGVGLHRQGDYTKAVETLEEARAEARRSGQLRVEATVLASLGDVYRDEGEYTHAQEAYQSAFDIAQRINEGFVLTYTLNALSETFRLTGDLATANQLIHQAIEQAESHHSNYELGLTETTLGILNCDQGDSTAATEHLSHAVELLEQGGAKRDSARAHVHLARTYLMRYQYREVNRHLKATATLGKHLREDQFVVADGRQLLPVIKYAVSKKVGNGYFVRVLDKIKSLPLAPVATKSAGSMEIISPQIEARALGVATALVDGRLVTKADWDSATTKELLFFLLANPQGLRKEQILNTLWSDSPPAKANGIFHSTAYRMRRALFPDCLVYEDGLYRINTQINLKNDVAEFLKAVQQAGKAETEEERAAFIHDAIALYQGDYFEDSYSDWCVPIRTDLQSKYLDALWSLALYYDQCADTHQAIALYRRILDKDSYREDVYRAMMGLQWKSGDRAGALKTYQQCTYTLKEEMDLDPSPETQALYQRILKKTEVGD